MAIDQVGKTLWTPGGHIPLREKDVEPLSRDEIITLSRMHELAYRFGWQIICPRCESGVQGYNNDSTPQLAVQCACREYRFVRA